MFPEEEEVRNSNVDKHLAMRQSAIRQFLLKEMTLRVIKNYIRNSIREFKCSSTTRNSTTDITVLFKQTIASVYNEIFSETSYEANLFWKQKVRCLLFLKYGEQSAPLSDYENRPSMDLRTILLSKDGSDGKFSLLLELPQFTGVSICNKEKLKTYQVNPTDLGLLSLHAAAAAYAARACFVNQINCIRMLYASREALLLCSGSGYYSRCISLPPRLLKWG